MQRPGLLGEAVLALVVDFILYVFYISFTPGWNAFANQVNNLFGSYSLGGTTLGQFLSNLNYIYNYSFLVILILVDAFIFLIGWIVEYDSGVRQ